MNITDPIYSDENKAREHLEALLWPNGPTCPHCGNVDGERITKLQGKAHRPGLYRCAECEKQFSVTVGTVMERSHIAINKWLLATHLMTASKKGISAHQLHRMLGVTYKTAWFMAHRIREAMKDDRKGGPLGGEGKTVIVDESYIGGKGKNRAYAKTLKPKQMVVSLVEHGGRLTSFHVANVGADTLREILFTNVDLKSTLVSDESNLYRKTGQAYAEHQKVFHYAREYVGKHGASTNQVENFFSLLKRGIYGVYHHVSKAHLHRYCAEFDFRYNGRDISDAERTAQALGGVVGKRLTYRRTNEARYA